MRIGELADATGTTAKTLRYYESIGLLAEPERSSSGYRSYGPPAIDRVRFIRDAQASGLSLTEIRSILELKDAGEGTCSHTRTLLHRHLDDLDEQIERLQQARRELAELSSRADELDPQACTDPNRCQVIAPDA